MSYRNILIVKLSAIGDVIHALPVAYALKHCFPQARITWVVEKPAFELVDGHPAIDDVIIFDKARCRSLSKLVNYLPELRRRLQVQPFDLALDLQGLFKSAMIAWLSGAPKRLVYCNAREFSDRISQKVCGPNQKGHIVEQYLDVVRVLACRVETVDFGIRFNKGETSAAQQILTVAGWKGEPYVVLAPGANWPNKRWPTSHFAELADYLHQKGILSLMIGGPADKALADEIRAQTNVAILDLIGKTSLKQLAWVIKNARVMVGGDTGPMHLSVAVSTPTVAIMGPTDAQRNGPYGNGHKALIAPRECAGCWRRKCKKGLDCLDAVFVKDVVQAVNAVFYKN